MKESAQYKIVHLVWGYKTGGIETMLLDITRFQVEASHSVTLIVVNDIINEELLSHVDSRVQVICMRRRPASRNPMPIVRLNRLLRKINPDVIHCHDAGLISILFGRLRKKCVLTMHSMPELVPGVEKRITLYPAVYAISSSVQKALRRDFRIDAPLIINGIHTEKFAVRPYSVPDMEKAPLKLVTVGRLLLEQKGQDTLIEAMSLLPDLNLHLTIYGDGPDREKIESLIRECGQSERIDLPGNLEHEELFGHLKDFDAFIMASRKEGFGLTVIEAMAAMLPVVAANAEGPFELTVGGTYGHLFERGSAASCASAIRNLCSHFDSEARLANARKYVQDHYDVSETAERYIAAYGRFINPSEE